MTALSTKPCSPFHRLVHAALRWPRRLLLLPLASLGRPGNIVMFHTGRSGSTVLGDLLGQHAGIFWDGEIFQNSSSLWLPRKKRKDPGRTQQAARHLRSRMRLAGRCFYGVEMKFMHLSWIGMSLEGFLALTRRLKFSHYVILRRRNQLRALVSSLVADATGSFHNRKEGHTAPTRIRIDVENVSRSKEPLSLPDYFTRQNEEFESLLRQLAGERVLSLVYEDDIEKDPSVAYRRVIAFLGLEPTPVQVNLRRTNPFPLSEIIENVDDVKAALLGTPFEWMLQDSEHVSPC